MAEVGKVLYIVVVDDGDDQKEKGKESFRYTRPVLQSTLQLMGCKARHAFKISKRVFELIRSESFPDTLRPEGILTSGIDALYELYKRRTTAIVRRETFLDIVCAALAEYKYVGPNQRTDLILACRYDIDFYLCEDHFDLQLLEENRKKNLLLVTTTSLVS